MIAPNKLKLYKLVLKNNDDVSCLWKGLHTACFILVALFGYAASYTFGKTLYELNFNCYLYGNVSIANNSEPGFNKSYDHVFIPISNDLYVNNAKTTWNNNSLLCNYCQTVPVVSSIIAFIFAVFYGFASTGGEIMGKIKFTSVWKMVYPTVFCCLIITSLLFSTHYFLISGFEAFRAPFNESTYEEDIHLYTMYFRKNEKSFMLWYFLSREFVFVCFWLWILQMFLLIIRVLMTADYDIYRLRTADESTISLDKHLI